MLSALHHGNGTTINVAIIEDHPLFRQGLCQVIESTPGMRVCGVAEDVEEGIRLIQSAKPTVAVVDIRLNKSNGLDLLRELKRHHLDISVLVMSMYEESLYAEKVLRAGARGYLAKGAHAEQFLEAIARVGQGQIYLSDSMTEKVLKRSLPDGENEPKSDLRELSSREIQVFHEIGRGSAVHEIARNLHLGITTVHTYRARIKEKLRLKDGEELCAFATRWVIEHGAF